MPLCPNIGLTELEFCLWKIPTTEPDQLSSSNQLAQSDFSGQTQWTHWYAPSWQPCHRPPAPTSKAPRHPSQKYVETEKDRKPYFGFLIPLIRGGLADTNVSNYFTVRCLFGLLRYGKILMYARHSIFIFFLNKKTVTERGRGRGEWTWHPSPRCDLKPGCKLLESVHVQAEVLETLTVIPRCPLQSLHQPLAIHIK